MPRRPAESDPKKEVEYRLAEIFRKRDMPEKLLRLRLAPIVAWAHIKGVDLGDAFYQLLPFSVDKPGPKAAPEFVKVDANELPLTPEPAPANIESGGSETDSIEKDFDFGD